MTYQEVRTTSPDYTVEVSASAAQTRTWVERRGDTWLKVVAIAYRVPSLRKIIVRRLHDATDADLAELLALRDVRGSFARWEAAGFAHDYSRSDGSTGSRVAVGILIDDPLEQVEFEMMIASAQGAHVDRQLHPAGG